MEVAARPLGVESLILMDRPDADNVTLEMVCGKGGYVRSIARDLGEVLGCKGHVRELRRTWSGPFEVENAITLAQVEEMAKTPALDEFLGPLETGLQELPQVTASSEGAVRLRNGNPGMVFANDVEYGDECWASHEGTAVAVGIFKSGELHPSRVFNTPE